MGSGSLIDRSQKAVVELGKSAIRFLQSDTAVQEPTTGEIWAKILSPLDRALASYDKKEFGNLPKTNGAFEMRSHLVSGG